jgi:hypothetical protein
MPAEAAVRQRSMALITFNWSRLTWPALAERHAVPLSRKISRPPVLDATWPLAGYARPVLLVLPGLLARLRQPIERALDALAITPVGTRE